MAQYSEVLSGRLTDVRTSLTTFTRQWERYWNLAIGLLWDRPHVHTHRTSSTAFDRQPSIAVDHGWWREFECYWNLLMLDFWYRTAPHVRMLPKVMDSIRMPSTTVDGIRTHANACKGVSENAALILDCWPLHMAERFGTVYRIAIFCAVSYRIVSYPSFSPMAISRHH